MPDDYEPSDDDKWEYGRDAALGDCDDPDLCADLKDEDETRADVVRSWQR